jgi:hypothetical protein
MCFETIEMRCTFRYYRRSKYFLENAKCVEIHIQEDRQKDSKGFDIYYIYLETFILQPKHCPSAGRKKISLNH